MADRQCHRPLRCPVACPIEARVSCPALKPLARALSGCSTLPGNGAATRPTLAAEPLERRSPDCFGPPPAGAAALSAARSGDRSDCSLFGPSVPVDGKVGNFDMPGTDCTSAIRRGEPGWPARTPQGDLPPTASMTTLAATHLAGTRSTTPRCQPPCRHPGQDAEAHGAVTGAPGLPSPCWRVARPLPPPVPPTPTRRWPQSAPRSQGRAR